MDVHKKGASSVSMDETTPTTENPETQPTPQNETPKEEVSQPPPQEEIAKDLSDKLGALKGIAQCHMLLAEGSFKAQALHMIIQTQEFLRELHKQVLASALEHEDAEKVEELKKLKKQIEEEQKYGKVPQNRKERRELEKQHSKTNS